MLAAYRYGFPDLYAYGPPVRPMHYDQSRQYQGVIGRRYSKAQTARYYALYDQNMYLQPGVPAGLGATATSTWGSKIAIAGAVLAVGALALAFATRPQ
jgi:hypothetical protein